jgi:DNA-binding transcriptional MocR family regulator
MIEVMEDHLMNMQEYLKNRAAFPLEELAKHRGEWVAWSPDGTRLVATSRDPDALDDLIRAAGEDPENCLITGIPDSDSVLGGLDAS